MSAETGQSTRRGSAGRPGRDDRLSDRPVGTNGWKVEGPATSGAAARRAGGTVERSAVVDPRRGRGRRGSAPVAASAGGAPWWARRMMRGAPGNPRRRTTGGVQRRGQLHGRPVGVLRCRGSSRRSSSCRIAGRRGCVGRGTRSPRTGHVGVTDLGVGVRSEAARCPVRRRCEIATVRRVSRGAARGRVGSVSVLPGGRSCRRALRRRHAGARQRGAGDRHLGDSWVGGQFAGHGHRDHVNGDQAAEQRQLRRPDLDAERVFG